MLQFSSPLPIYQGIYSAYVASKENCYPRCNLSPPVLTTTTPPICVQPSCAPCPVSFLKQSW